MPRTITFSFRKANVPPGEDCVPGNFQELLDRLIENIEIVDVGSGDSVNIGSTEPAPDERGKPWIATDVNGAPAGLRQFYEGAWRPMTFLIGMQLAFNGPEAEIVKPWYKADGNNGTENRSGEFVPPNKWIIEYRGF